MRKKIALLNFPLDNNYGGNLQRYALMKVLTDMGYDVIHLSTRFRFEDKRKISKQIKMWIKFALGRLNQTYPAQILQWRYTRSLRATMPFYDTYIPHTQPIYDYEELASYDDYDIYVVGSDQVWRRSMSGAFPYSAMFFDFVKNPKAKRIAYGVSMGTASNELSNEEISVITPLYSQFNAVSVREVSALDLFKQYGWNNPQAEVVLDPTLLLDRRVYEEIISNAKTRAHKEEIFCYVLDVDTEKQSKIDAKSAELNAKAHYCVLGKDRIFIEQWLRNFRDAKYVITDSYHGVLFSIIFNKPFTFLKNERRGNERVISILNRLEIEEDRCDLNWSEINNRIIKEQEKSLDFIKRALFV